MILEALFNGDIYASENIVPKSDTFRKATAHISKTMTYFEGKLSPDDYAMLEKLCDSYADEGNMTNECQFKYGFTLGVLLMCESSIVHSSHAQNSGQNLDNSVSPDPTISYRK